jgi:membrane-bound ClpP family serine protease
MLALVSSVLYAGFFWLVIQKTLQAAHARPLHDLSALVGQLGEAKTRIHKDGSVQVAGELWSARSETPIPSGTFIRVVAREGFILVVEKHAN